VPKMLKPEVKCNHREIHKEFSSTPNIQPTPLTPKEKEKKKAYNKFSPLNLLFNLGMDHGYRHVNFLVTRTELL